LCKLVLDIDLNSQELNLTIRISSFSISIVKLSNQFYFFHRRTHMQHPHVCGGQRWCDASTINVTCRNGPLASVQTLRNSCICRFGRLRRLWVWTVDLSHRPCSFHFQVSLASSHRWHVRLIPLGLLCQSISGIEHDPNHVLL